ncbi:MAG: hypothetical protein ACI4T9_12440 [Prevotella sp.]
MQYIKYFRNIFSLALSFLLAFSMFACSDKFDDEEGHTPTWLGSNIYDYLQSRGDCKYFVKLIEDEGMKDVMRLSGSNTVFFYNDEAFDRFFQNNTMGIRSYNQLPESMKRMFLRFSVIDNAQLIDRLSLSDYGQYLLRRTTSMQVDDTIPVVAASSLPNNQFFAALRAKGRPVKLLQDATQWTLVQFFPNVMANKKITNTDLQMLTGDETASIDSTYLYSNRVIKRDLICKNGYLHELKDVLLPPDNMAGYIRKNSDLSSFSSLLDRFACPMFYKKDEKGDSVYELRYFNTGKRALTQDGHDVIAPATLLFDPGWNLYASTTATSKTNPYEETMGCMFVPTNEALAKFFSPTGEGADFYNAFGSWDKVPTSMVADVINAQMKNNFLTALPSVFDKIEDENGYSMDISTSDIKNTYIARNGLVYVTNKVFAPQDYKTVMGPAKIDVNNSVFNMAISNEKYSYYAYLLRAPKNIYYFFVTPNAYTKDYVDPVAQGYSSAAYRCKLNFSINASNNLVAAPYNISSGELITKSGFPLGAGGVVTTGMSNRWNDILGTSMIVCSYDGEMEDRIASGQEYFVSNSYAPVRVRSLAVGGKVAGSGNDNELTISKSFRKSNGRTFIIDGLLQNTTKSIFDVLKSRSEFKDFFDICQAVGVFSSTSNDHNATLDYMVRFLGRYCYTVYVPTNAAIEKAQAQGIIPTVSEWENEGDAEKKKQMEDQLLRFVKYHFQDYSVFIKGKKENDAEYFSSTLNEKTSKFFPIKVTNTGSAITLKDNKGQTAHVVTSGGNYNLIARDIVVNNRDRDQATEILSYAYAVIHQIDHVLNYE